MSADSGTPIRRVLAEVVAFLLLVPMIGTIRATSDAWEWLLLGSVWVAASILLQVALPWKHKPSYALFVISILAGFVFSIALTEFALNTKGIEPGTASNLLLLAVNLALYVVCLFVSAEELFFQRIVVFGWRQHTNIALDTGLTVVLVSALYILILSRYADSWSSRTQITSLYTAMVIALATLWFSRGRSSPRLAPLVMLVCADVLLRFVLDELWLLSPVTWVWGWIIVELVREAAGEDPWLLTRWRRRKGLSVPTAS